MLKFYGQQTIWTQNNDSVSAFFWERLPDVRWLVDGDKRTLQQLWIKRYTDFLYRMNAETEWRDVESVFLQTIDATGGAR